MVDQTSTLPNSAAQAVKVAQDNHQRSIDALATLVRIPSLTGEEAAAQVHLRRILEEAGADVIEAEPDVEAMFAAYSDIAQYPTHWQHDLILPYAHMPSFAAL